MARIPVDNAPGLQRSVPKCYFDRAVEMRVTPRKLTVK